MAFHPRRPKSIENAGFTLVEVLIALVILAIGAVTLLELQLSSMRSSERAARQSQALWLAGQRMSEALSDPSLEIGSRSGETDPDTPGGPLNWTVTVDDLSGSDIQNISTIGLRSVTVNVSWPEGDDVRSVQLINYTARRNSNAAISR